MGTFLKSRCIAALVTVAVAAIICWPSAIATGAKSAPTLIACLHKGEFRYLSRPVRCNFYARLYFPDGRLRRFRDVGAKRLRWTNWGDPVAVGVGKSELAVPITVKAFDRVRCSDGRWYYGKVFTRSTVGHDHHLRLARCGAKRFPPFSQ